MSQNKIVILGSSSGYPGPTRATSGYILEVDDRLSLIDCGGGVCQSFLRRGFDPLKVDRVFISHTHSDHICELTLFIQLIYLAGRKACFEVYLPEEAVEPFRNWMNTVYLFDEKLPFEIILHGYQSGFVYDADFRLTAIGNNHLNSHSEFLAGRSLSNKMQANSFLIEVGEKSVLYSSDIAGLDDVFDSFDGRDIVLLELTHVDRQEFFAKAGSVDVGQYVITHLGDDNDVVAINDAAHEAGLQNLTTAVDGLELRL